jgi:5-(carboxyamino)imidazole ribonucleotide synthase
MANLLGDLWAGGEPDWTKVCAVPEVKLHLYGKLAAKPGRKMGHLTALADSPDCAAQLVRETRDRLIRPSAE